MLFYGFTSGSGEKKKPPRSSSVVTSAVLPVAFYDGAVPKRRKGDFLSNKYPVSRVDSGQELVGVCFGSKFLSSLHHHVEFDAGRRNVDVSIDGIALFTIGQCPFVGGANCRFSNLCMCE